MAEQRAHMTVEAKLVLDAAAVRAGDTLVVRLAGTPDPEEAAEAKQRLSRLLPGVEIVVVAGIEQLVVHRPEAEWKAAGDNG